MKTNVKGFSRKYHPKLLRVSSATIPILFAFASDASASPGTVDTGTTAWMMVATALVLLMTIPGLALFMPEWFRKKTR